MQKNIAQHVCRLKAVNSRCLVHLSQSSHRKDHIVRNIDGSEKSTKNDTPSLQKSIFGKIRTENKELAQVTKSINKIIMKKTITKINIKTF